MATLAEQAEKLLDFTQKLDIQLLDSIVSYMYTADGQQVVYEVLFITLIVNIYHMCIHILGVIEPLMNEVACLCFL